ncbi:MAG: phenylacetate-CoA oxygenase subunit PaaI [Alphaproteobacteria bacterium]|nr:MAG: phenylacetate-CoA oxygenase subunit PaaI [Alphaproteobacteria bacterium]
MRKKMTDMVFEGLLRLADDNLILGHRTSEWCGHAPTLEEDLALPNIALDLIGHAQALYILACELNPKYANEDALAFLRLEHEYKNVLLVEQENGHFGNTVLRLFYFSTFMKYFWEALKEQCCFEKLKKFSEKAVLETSYHSQYSSQWVITLGDGTEESNRKMSDAIINLEPFVGELFSEDNFTRESFQKDFFPELGLICEKWKAEVQSVFTKANLDLPNITLKKRGGRNGEHTEVFGYLLSDLQYMQRTFPNSSW